MRTSQKGIQLIKQAEGFINHIYPDADYYSIGYGTFLKGRPDLYERYKDGSTISESDASILLTKHVANIAEPTVNKAIKVPVNQNQFDALICLCYNIGNGAFASSTLVKKINQKDYTAGAEQFLVWNKVNHQTDKGLSARREKERALFLSSVV